VEIEEEANGEDANSSGNEGRELESANGFRIKPSRTCSKAKSAIDDAMKRGECSELMTQSGSHSRMRRPGSEMNRRSRSAIEKGTM
jgi:hypothetical protein